MRYRTDKTSNTYVNPAMIVHKWNFIVLDEGSDHAGGGIADNGDHVGNGIFQPGDKVIYHGVRDHKATIVKENGKGKYIIRIEDDGNHEKSVYSESLTEIK